VISNTFLYELIYAFPVMDEALAMYTDIVRICEQIAYVLLIAVLAFLLARVIREMDTVSLSVAVGVVLLCAICVFALRLLVDMTAVAHLVGIGTVSYGIISILVMALVMLLMILFRSVSNWSRRFAAEQVKAEYLARQQQYYKEMDTVSAKVRQLKHDYANHMSVIASMAERDELEEIQQYMQTYGGEYCNIDRYAVTGHDALDSLLSYKLMTCREENIDTRIKAVADLRSVALTPFEISSLFGNMLDNAINACRQLDIDRRWIRLDITTKGDMLCIEMENSMASDTREKRADGEHGMGLPRIKSIVEAHQGSIILSPKEDRYVVKILLPMTK